MAQKRTNAASNKALRKKDLRLAGEEAGSAQKEKSPRWASLLLVLGAYWDSWQKRSLFRLI